MKELNGHNIDDLGLACERPTFHLNKLTLDTGGSPNVDLAGVTSFVIPVQTTRRTSLPRLK
jgi:hypothetical protein